jgi:hypothetical protein
MKYLKINDEKIPSEVLITFIDRLGKEQTNHYCFRSSKSKTYLICHTINGKILKNIINYFMQFILSNPHTPMTLKKFKKLKAFI